MILTVTLNAALDVTYEVEKLVPHGSHRVRVVGERAGGKGINVASVLHAMGVEVTATGLLAGRTGDQIGADLDERGVAHEFLSCAGGSRRTVNVVSAGEGDATIFNEPGPHVTIAEWSLAVDGVSRLITRLRPSVVVLSGSLPEGVPEDAYARLVALARGHGARTIVDADGAPLRLAVAAHPDVVKPNLSELTAATGEPRAVEGAEVLRRGGALDVVVSAGGEGVVALPRAGGQLAARLRSPLSGNPTGAGDALVAALAAALAGQVTGEATAAQAGLRAAEHDWSATMTLAVAWSAAAVLQPVAGAVDPQDVARLVPEVEVKGR